MIEIMGLSEIGQIFVVCEDLDCGGGPQEVMAPGVQSLHDGKQFMIIDIVIVFSWPKCLGKVGTGMPIPVDVLLQQHSA